MVFRSRFYRANVFAALLSCGLASALAQDLTPLPDDLSIPGLEDLNPMSAAFESSMLSDARIAPTGSLDLSYKSDGTARFNSGVGFLVEADDTVFKFIVGTDGTMNRTNEIYNVSAKPKLELSLDNSGLTHFFFSKLKIKNAADDGTLDATLDYQQNVELYVNDYLTLSTNHELTYASRTFTVTKNAFGLSLSDDSTTFDVSADVDPNFTSVIGEVSISHTADNYDTYLACGNDMFIAIGAPFETPDELLACEATLGITPGGTRYSLTPSIAFLGDQFSYFTGAWAPTDFLSQLYEAQKYVSGAFRIETNQDFDDPKDTTVVFASHYGTYIDLLEVLNYDVDLEFEQRNGDFRSVKWTSELAGFVDDFGESHTARTGFTWKIDPEDDWAMAAGLKYKLSWFEDFSDFGDELEGSLTASLTPDALRKSLGDSWDIQGDLEFKNELKATLSRLDFASPFSPVLSATSTIKYSF